MNSSLQINTAVTVVGSLGLGATAALVFDEDKKKKNFLLVVGAIGALGLAIFVGHRLYNHVDGEGLDLTMKAMRQIVTQLSLFAAPSAGLSVGFALTNSPLAFPGLVAASAVGSLLYSLGLYGFQATISLMSRHFIQLGIAPTLGILATARLIYSSTR